jgi:hypothetical protein
MSRFPFKDLPYDKLREFFDVGYPTVAQIRERYKDRVIDLNHETTLTRQNVALAIKEAAEKNAMLYIPASFPAWEGLTFSKKELGKEVSIKVDTPYRFKKFGPEVNINTTRMGVNESREFDFMGTFHRAISNADARAEMLKGTRGIGYWRPRQKDHVIMMWYLFPQGYGFANQKKLGGRAKVKSRLADAKVEVPSFSNIDSSSGRVRRFYEIDVLTLPVHVEDGFFRQELLQTEWRGARCPDVSYRETKGTVSEDPAIIAMSKYSRPEHVICKHIYTAEFLLFKQKEPDKPNVLAFRYPVPTLLNSKIFRTLKTGAIRGSPDRGGKRRKLTMAEISSFIGMEAGSLKPEEMFHFDLAYL